MRSLHGFSLNQLQGAEAAGGGEKRVTEEQRGWRGHPACIWTSGLSEGQILPGQLASNPAWSLCVAANVWVGGLKGVVTHPVALLAPCLAPRLQRTCSPLVHA